MIKIPFSPPYIDQSVIDEVTATLRSGWITTGPKVKELEDAIALQTGHDHVLCVNSWTSGAILMFHLLGLRKGDQVIIPAYTYCATALAVLHAGGIPVLVDVDKDFNMDPARVEAAITPRTKAIMPVDIGGYPCRYKALMKLVSAPRIRSKFHPTSPLQEQLGRITIIADNAHSMGSHLNDRPDVSIYSLHAVKNITSAEGGAVCLNFPPPVDNAALCPILRCASLNCQTKDAYAKETTGFWKYDITGLGMKINLPDVNAAIALAQMRQLPALRQRRKELFTAYVNAFKDIPWAILPPAEGPDGEGAYHLFMLRIKGIDSERRDRIMARIMEKGVAVNVHFQPLPLLTYFKEAGFRMKDYPQALANYQHEISLPLYPQLTVSQVEFVVQCVIEAYNETTV